MNVPMKLLWKLLSINSMAILIVILTIGLAVHLRAATYFTTLTNQYNIAPADAHAMFLQAVDRYLLMASATGFVFASVLSLWLNFRLTRPITRITQAAKLIADGDYAQRVTTRGCGEIDLLSTAFNSMAERLQRTDRLRKDFIVDVAHELRTPLTNIRGYIEGLRDEVIAPEKAIFESVHEESLRLVHLVEDLLQLARADVAVQDLNTESFDFATLIEQILQTFKLRFTEKALRVDAELRSPVPIVADRLRLSQVLTNLFENALRYTPRGGLIRIRCERPSNLIRTVISNDVEGSPDLPDSLFERFQRGEASRSRDYGGAGIGLAIVRKLIEAHLGRVGIRLNNGQAELWFELPRGKNEVVGLAPGQNRNWIEPNSNGADR